MIFLIVHLFICSFVRSRQLILSLISLYPPLLKITSIRIEFGPLSIGEICADELFFVPLHCESSPHEQVFEGPRTSIRSEANKDSFVKKRYQRDSEKIT